MSNSDDQREHSHLDEDELDSATEHYLTTAEVPECEVCADAVRAQAQYLTMAGVIGGHEEVPDSAPAVSAIRAIRRKTYAPRAFEQILRMLTPGRLEHRR